MTPYAQFIEWSDVTEGRRYVHPWCAVWIVAKPSSLETVECHGCHARLPVRPA